MTPSSNHRLKEGKKFKFTDTQYMTDFTSAPIQERAIKIETTIKFFIKPKPRFIPKAIWVWILKKLVLVDLAENWSK